MFGKSNCIWSCNLDTCSKFGACDCKGSADFQHRDTDQDPTPAKQTFNLANFFPILTQNSKLV